MGQTPTSIQNKNGRIPRFPLSINTATKKKKIYFFLKN
jgi:hypothetical protein